MHTGFKQSAHQAGQDPDQGGQYQHEEWHLVLPDQALQDRSTTRRGRLAEGESLLHHE